MNAGVALVRSYLQLNGYFTVSELPVIQKDGEAQFHEVTDIDILALRFPKAAHVVSGGRPGPPGDLTFAQDAALDIPADAMDLIIGEVKQGKPKINPALRSYAALYRALVRTGVCTAGGLDRIIGDIQQHGRAEIAQEELGIPARVRLVAFGDGEPAKGPGFEVMSLQGIADFIRRHLEEHRPILKQIYLSDPVLGLLNLVGKVEPPADGAR